MFRITDALSHGVQTAKARPYDAARIFAVDALFAGGLFLAISGSLARSPSDPSFATSAMGGAASVLLALEFFRNLLSDAAWWRFLARRDCPGWMVYRLGGDEWRLFVFWLVASILAALVLLAPIIVFVVILSVLGQGVTWLLTTGAGVLILVVLAVISPVGPLLVMRRTFEPWRAIDDALQHWRGVMSAYALAIAAFAVALLPVVIVVAGVSAGSGAGFSMEQLGTRFDAVHQHGMVWPLGSEDVAITITYAIIMTALYLVLRGIAAYTARLIEAEPRPGAVEDLSATPPASSDGPGPAPRPV
ncbi:MAG: hypothetical protein AAFX09_00435 [Pseudomonadota bacterium]